MYVVDIVINVPDPYCTRPSVSEERHRNVASVSVTDKRLSLGFPSGEYKVYNWSHVVEYSCRIMTDSEINGTGNVSRVVPLR